MSPALPELWHYRRVGRVGGACQRRSRRSWQIPDPARLVRLQWCTLANHRQGGQSALTSLRFEKAMTCASNTEDRIARSIQSGCDSDRAHMNPLLPIQTRHTSPKPWAKGQPLWKGESNMCRFTSDDFE